jgi:uncharacterized protein (DUF924 family)
MSSNNPDLSGLLLSPLVVAARMPILWYEALNPDPSRRNETNRMVAEKFTAAHEGILGAQMALSKAFAETAAAFAFGQVPRATPRNTAQAMMHASLAPAAKQVKANAKRLGKR